MVLFALLSTLVLDHRIIVIENDQYDGPKIVQKPVDELTVASASQRFERGPIANPKIKQSQQKTLVSQMLRLWKFHQVAPTLVLPLGGGNLFGQSSEVLNQPYIQLSRFMVNDCV